MENTYEINGKTYTKQEIQKIIDKLIEFAKKVEKAIDSFVAFVTKTIENIIGFIANLVETCEETANQKMKYHLMSEGKSNNWRKIHGLSLRRKS